MHKYLLLLLPFIIGCSAEEVVVTPMGVSFCEPQELQIISDGQSCNIDDNFLICELLTIEETQFIDKGAYEWSPNICDFQIGDQITFKNQGSTSFFNVVDRGHHIAKERINISCNENYESSTFICQKNEVIYVSFLNNLLGQDTISIELRTMTITYDNQSPGEKRNIINLYQDRSNSNIRNFWMRHYIGDDYYDYSLQSYHQEIKLNGTFYEDVIRYQYGKNIHADPDFKYYIQKGTGILGFEVNDRLWLRV